MPRGFRTLIGSQRMEDPGQDEDGAPAISVVLPVRNEAAHIAGVLADLRAQDIDPTAVEILVVDGRSTDDTRERVRAIAAKDPRVRLLDNPLQLSSGARAVGAEAARGTYVAYVDGHCRIPSRSLLSDMLALFESSGADCLARPQPLVAGAGGARARAIAAARHSPLGHSTRSEIFGATEGPVSPVSSGAMYRRAVFERVGNFDTAFDACEDVEFNYRVEAAGLLAWSSPKLAVAYEPRGTYRGLWRQMLRYGLGRARLHRKHPAAFSVESLIPAGFVLGLPVLAASPWLGFPLAWIPLGLYGLYVLLALLFAARAAVEAGWRLLPLIALAFPVLHAGLGVGYLQGRLGRMLRTPDAEGDA
jgi:GT2 family glycosyltransferase